MKKNPFAKVFEVRATGDAIKGRGVFLTKDANHGDVLMRENPPVIALPKHLQTREELRKRATTLSLGPSLAVDYLPPTNRAPPLCVCANCLRFVGSVPEQLDFICDDMAWPHFSPELLEPFKGYEKPLSASAPCKECSIEFCSNCVAGPLKAGGPEDWHSWLCPHISISDIAAYIEDHTPGNEDTQSSYASSLDESKGLAPEELDRLHALRQFWNAHFQFPNFKLLIGARLVVLILNALKRSDCIMRSILEARSEAIGDFATTPYSHLIVLQERLKDPDNNSLVARLKDNSLTPEELVEAKKAFDALLALPLEFLKTALAPLIKSRYGSDKATEVLDNVFSPESWDRILGVAHVNMVEVRTYSPLHHWFNDAITLKPMDAQPIYQFLMMIRERYGGIPYCDGAALFSIYSKANHACKFNAISMGNEIDEIKSPDQFARTAFVVVSRAYKGEELVIPYINVAGKFRAKRQRELWLKYGFLCQCSCCACGNPDCTSLEGAGRRLLCTKCKIVSYCSPGCQKANWASHKLICKAPTAASTPAKK